MANDPQLKGFLGTDGSTSFAGQQNAGTWQANSGQPLSGQQSWESFDAYAARQSAYDGAKKSGS
jgi:hypothetical protein